MLRGGVAADGGGYYGAKADRRDVTPAGNRLQRDAISWCARWWETPRMVPEPNLPLNPWFMQIVEQGTAGEFSMEVNQRWLEATRPILEAFFHARYFLEMACKYGKELNEPPDSLPSGWAAVLYLYGLR